MNLYKLLENTVVSIMDYEYSHGNNEYDAICRMHEFGKIMMSLAEETIKEWHHDIFSNGVKNLFQNIL
jgi:hypothetical protein